MRCPKCGYHSFDGLDSCKSCGSDLAGYRQSNACRVYSAPAAATADVTAPLTFVPVAAAVVPEPEEDSDPDDGDIDFGFDILEAEPPAEPEPSPLPELAAGGDDWGSGGFAGGEVDDPSVIDFPVDGNLDFDNPFAADDDSPFAVEEQSPGEELPKLDSRFDF